MALRYNGILKLGDQVSSFRTVWDTRNLSDGSSGDNQIELPLKGLGYNFNVNWGDGSVDYGIQNSSDSRKLHTYATPGIYEIRITGNIVNWGFNGGGDCEKLLRVLEFGPLVLPSNATQVFLGCVNLDITATDFPDTSLVENFSFWFGDCKNLIWNSNAASLDTSSGKLFNGMFQNCHRFNQDNSGWDMSNAENISYMHNYNYLYNQNAGLWDITDKLTSAVYVFNECYEMSYSLNNWNVSNVTSLAYALHMTKVQGIDEWRPISCTNLDYFISGNKEFNDDLSDWVLPVIEIMRRTFNGCEKYNNGFPQIPNPTLTTLDNVLSGAREFQHKSFEAINTASCSNFRSVLAGVYKANFDLSGWNVESGIDFTNFMAESSNGYSMSMENYDKLLASWSAQDVNSGITITFSGISYKNSATERSVLEGKGWTINDGGFKDIDESIVLRHEFNEGFYDFSRDNSYYGNHGYMLRPELAAYEESPVSGLAYIVAATGTGTTSNAYVNIETSPSLQSVTDGFTIDMYVKNNLELSSGMPFFTNCNKSEENGIDISALSGASGRFRAWINYFEHANDFMVQSNVDQIIEFDNYNRLTLTYDGNEFKIFINKVIGSTKLTPSPLSIQSVLDWRMYHKGFDNVTVYNKPLTDQEVQDLSDGI